MPGLTLPGKLALMTLPDLGPAAQRMADLVAGVPDAPDDLLGPTPCHNYRVGDLLEHIATLSVAFAAAATKETQGIGDRPPSGDMDHLPDDWRERVPRDLVALAEAWRAPEAWTGMTKVGGVDLPGEAAGIICLDELVLHGWDLAMATGQPFSGEESTLAVVHDFVAQLSEPGQEELRAQLFGPEVPVPADAPLLDRVLGLSGRSPRWSPGTGV
jgi:uncharacterized protein (TIGR03086 family)